MILFCCFTHAPSSSSSSVSHESKSLIDGKFTQSDGALSSNPVEQNWHNIKPFNQNEVDDFLRTFDCAYSMLAFTGIFLDEEAFTNGVGELNGLAIYWDGFATELNKNIKKFDKCSCHRFFLFISDWTKKHIKAIANNAEHSQNKLAKQILSKQQAGYIKNEDIELLWFYDRDGNLSLRHTHRGLGFYPCFYGVPMLPNSHYCFVIKNNKLVTEPGYILSDQFMNYNRAIFCCGGERGKYCCIILYINQYNKNQYLHILFDILMGQDRFSQFSSTDRTASRSESSKIAGDFSWADYLKSDFQIGSLNLFAFSFIPSSRLNHVQNICFNFRRNIPHYMIALIC